MGDASWEYILKNDEGQIANELKETAILEDGGGRMDDGGYIVYLLTFILQTGEASVSILHPYLKYWDLGFI